MTKDEWKGWFEDAYNEGYKQAQALQLQQTGVNKRFYCQDEFYDKKEKCDKQCITCFSKE